MSSEYYVDHYSDNLFTDEITFKPVKFNAAQDYLGNAIFPGSIVLGVIGRSERYFGVGVIGGDVSLGDPVMSAPDNWPELINGKYHYGKATKESILRESSQRLSAAICGKAQSKRLQDWIEKNFDPDYYMYSHLKDGGIGEVKNGSWSGPFAMGQDIPKIPEWICAEVSLPQISDGRAVDFKHIPNRYYTFWVKPPLPELLADIALGHDVEKRFEKAVDAGNLQEAVDLLFQLPSAGRSDYAPDKIRSTGLYLQRYMTYDSDFVRSMVCDEITGKVKEGREEFAWSLVKSKTTSFTYDW